MILRVASACPSIQAKREPSGDHAMLVQSRPASAFASCVSVLLTVSPVIVTATPRIADLAGALLLLDM
jgi:hypothetical protein